jgi:hypothetical protein
MSFFLAVMFFSLFGFAVGGTSIFFALEVQRRSIEEGKRQLADGEARLSTARVEFETNSAKWTADANAKLQSTQAQLQEKWNASFQELDGEKARVTDARRQLESKVVTYNELAGENLILKRDLRNLDINVRKLAFDREVEREAREGLEERINELGRRYLKENVKWIGASLNANNFVACKQRLQDVIERCRSIELPVSKAEETELLANLKSEFEMAVRQALEREEQARIKAQMREEFLRQKEFDREIKQLEREREAIQAALEKALSDAQGQHNEEVQRLQVRLAEAEEKAKRAISQAQLTKSGFVYILSNIGSFGADVFKVGMSRRLDPYERVRELGGAAVPFPFDVHVMISTNDAPTLENALHRALHKFRINKTNPRKEYFKTDIQTIIQLVKEHHGEVEYIADAEALQYRQSMSMTDEDQAFIEGVFADEEEDEEALVDDV